jgi:ABC-type polysaccharide/polyol phosphate export permease
MSEIVYRHSEQRNVARVIPDLIRNREVLRDLIWKDIRVRYRYAAMGFLWAVLEPVAMMLVLWFVFTQVFDFKSGMPGLDPNHSFAVLLLCGLVPWQFTSATLSAATKSLVENQNLVQKVHFPREIVPLAAVGNCLVNVVIGSVLLLIIHAITGGTFGVGLVAVPFVFAIQFALVIGLALLLSCLNVYFRDVSYIVDVGLIFGFYATPIIYTQAMVAGRLPQLLWLYSANPMVGLISAYRSALMDGQFPALSLLLWPALFAVVSLVVGVVVFRRNAPTISDHI